MPDSERLAAASLPPAGTSGSRAAAFGLRLALFTAIGALFLAAGGGLVRVVVNSGGEMDDRRRLLWDADAGNEAIVLLGDSIFCSYYVDGAGATLWARLGQLTGTSVFPGALDGARGPDIRSAAAIVAAEWRPGTVVIIQVAPSKLLPLREVPAEIPAERHGNYGHYLDRRVKTGDEETTATRLERALRFYASCPLPIVRYPESIKVLARRGLPFVFRPATVSRHVVWTDRQGAMRRKLDELLSRIEWGRQAVVPDWVAAAATSIRDAGMHPLVVVSPFNRDLVVRIADRQTADRIDELLDRAEATLERDPRMAGIPVLSLRHAVASPCFADFVHTNTCGDDTVARAISDWLASNAVPLQSAP